MTKTQILIITFIFPFIGFSQTKTDLSSLLWQNVESCYSNFEDNTDQISDVKIIDDSKNGYLSISGSFPTCGCYCSESVGAYKDNEGNYTILQSSFSSCDWTKTTTSNKALTEILPDNFGVKSFTSQDLDSQFNHPIFFIEVTIPQKGTDTKISLQLVPFGMYLDEENSVCYGYSESSTENKSFYNLINIVNAFNDKNTLDCILKEDFNSISKLDFDTIEKLIKNKNFVSKAEITNQLKELKKIYDAYLQIEHTELILGWNRESAKFYIKEKGEKQSFISFKEFLLKNQYWTAMC